MTFDINNVVIVVDKDVSPEPPKRIRGLDNNDPHVQQLRELDLGDSFFVVGATKKDVRPLVDKGRKLGMYILARETDSDEINVGQAGTRLWYRPDDERPRRSSKKDQTPAPETPPDDDDDL